MTLEIFKNNSYEISKLITKKYSTSFSLATSFLEKEKRKAIYAVYGFVRLADEIVDSMHNFDKGFLLNQLNTDLHYAVENGISTNTVLVAFADTVTKYGISKEHVDAFMKSMELDLTNTTYNTSEEIRRYIYGSADVVGLICLKIFCNGDEVLYNKLEAYAQHLGSAFQKVNFLRDLKTDMKDLGRTYFPEINTFTFNTESKQMIEKSIENDFSMAYQGIKSLPGRSRLAVSLAYFYYMGLFNKIKKIPPQKVLSARIRISNARKYFIMLKVLILYIFKLI